MTKKFFGKILYDIFITSFVVYLIVFLVEGIQKGFFVNFLNMNNILIVLLASALMVLLISPEQEKKKQRWPFLAMGAFFSILTSIYVYQNVFPLGPRWAVMFSVVSIIVVFFSLYSLTEEVPNK